MESQGNFDYKSDLDFPTLGSNVVNGDSKRNSSPPQQQKAKESNKDSRENSRSMSRGRGKKQNWKTVQVEFNNNGHGQRYQPRGTSRPRFGNNHAISRPTEEQPLDMGYRSYRSRNRRARGGFAPNHLGRPQSTDSMPSLLSPEHKPEQIPQIMAIPYTPNYATYVQPLSATIPPTEHTQVDIKEAIRRQIEYYFSEENLIKDSFMRTNMTKDGFLSIKLIANFNKIRLMDVDIETIIQAIEESDKLDVVDREMVRPVINPLRWPLDEPLPNLVQNFVHPLISPSLQSNIPLVENFQELNCEPVVEDAQPDVLELPPQMVYSDAEPASPEDVGEVTSSFANFGFNGPTSYGYGYDAEVDLRVIHGQQDLQDVYGFHNNLTQVSLPLSS